MIPDRLRRPSDWLRRMVGWRADVAGLLLGALSATALPPVHAIPMLLLAVPGLLVLIGAASGPVIAARRGFFFGLGHHICGLYWITEAIMLESARYWWLVPFAVPALAALMAVFIALPCAAARTRRAGWQRVAMLGGAWVLFDLARQFFGTGFPWNPWGSVWAIPGLAGDIMLQPLAWVGTPTMTLATVLIAASPALGGRAVAAAAAVLMMWAGLGAWRLHDPAPPPQDLVAVIVQGNVAQGQKWDRASAIAAFDRQLALTRQGIAEAAGRPTVVIWPETSSVFLLQSDRGARDAIADAARPARGMLIGGLTFRDGRPTADPENLPRNSLLALRADGAIEGTYDKWHLVPFGEYAPGWVPFAIQIVPGRFGFGTGPATLHPQDMPAVGGLICYEAIFPAQVVDQADRPAWLANVTNDAWFGNSSGPRQHLAAVRMRTVEDGLPLMRAANTGISAGFDSRGHELGRLALNEAGVLVLELPGYRPVTSFARWGLVIPGLLALTLCGMALTLRVG